MQQYSTTGITCRHNLGKMYWGQSALKKPNDTKQKPKNLEQISHMVWIREKDFQG